MNAEQALEWMKLFNEKIQEQKDYLSELDTPIGDGDHGGNMAVEWLQLWKTWKESNLKPAVMFLNLSQCNY